MKAKDTIMSDREILELHKAITPPEIYRECIGNAESLAIHVCEHHVTAERQAEITWDKAFKAGERKVVEWVNRWKKLAEHGDYSNGVEAFGVDEGRVRAYEFIKDLEDKWQEFLKLEGIA